MTTKSKKASIEQIREKWNELKASLVITHRIDDELIEMMDVLNSTDEEVEQYFHVIHGSGFIPDGSSVVWSLDFHIIDSRPALKNKLFPKIQDLGAIREGGSDDEKT